MTVRKVVYGSLVIALLIAAVFSFIIAIRKGLEFEAIIWAIVIMAILWALGVFIGVILSAIIRKPAIEPWIYISGQVLVLFAISAIYWYDQYEDARHEREYGNIEDNRRFIDFSHNPYPPSHDSQIQKAFARLEANFENPNAFHLTRFMTSIRDTLVENVEDSIVVIYFTYNVYKSERFSKISVFRDSAYMDIFNQLTSDNYDYQKQKSNSDRRIRDQIKSLKRDLDELPDSTRKKIVDTIRKALRE